MTPLLYVFVFVAAILLFESVRLLLEGRRSSSKAVSRRRLSRMAAGLSSRESGAEVSALRKRRSDGSGFEGLVRSLPVYNTLRLQLYRAGMAFGPARLIGICGVIGLLGWLIGNTVFPGGAAALPFALVGLLPWVWIARRARKRLMQFESQLPEALDLITRALRAGQSLTSGFRMVSTEMPDPIGFEFAQVADQVKLGQDMPAALADFDYRMGSPSVPFLVTAIVLQRETGSNLAEVLENLASVIRERFRFYGKVNALTATGRISANILAVWPLVMVGGIYMVNPSYVEPLWTTDAGHQMIMLSIPLVVIGYLLCRRLARVEA